MAKPNVPKPLSKLKLREKEPVEITTAAHGLARFSGQTALNAFEREREEKVLAVALAQPHRKGSRSRLRASPLGRLIERSYSDADVQETRFEAGNRYAQLLDNWLVAKGLQPRQYGPAGGDIPRDPAERLRLAEVALANAEAEIRRVDNTAVTAMRWICHEDREIPAQWEGRVLNALYRLSAFHFRLQEPSYHPA